MLTIILAEDEQHEKAELRLEHSLVSLSKWESIHEKAFFLSGKETHTSEEMLSYIRQMVLNEIPPEDFLDRLSTDDYGKINEYINSKQSATWFREEPGNAKSREVITSELIYYWLIQFQIPFSCENWHLNRLMTLIKICGIKQTKPKKMSREAMQQQYRDLNAKRRAQLGTNG